MPVISKPILVLPEGVDIKEVEALDAIIQQVGIAPVLSLVNAARAFTQDLRVAEVLGDNTAEEDEDNESNESEKDEDEKPEPPVPVPRKIPAGCWHCRASYVNIATVTTQGIVERICRQCNRRQPPYKN